MPEHGGCAFSRRLFGGGAHLVFESSQTMNDIPFGDHFRVESRWDFSQQPLGPGEASRTLVRRAGVRKPSPLTCCRCIVSPNRGLHMHGTAWVPRMASYSRSQVCWPCPQPSH